MSMQYVANEIRVHIPMVELSLIIEDYIATPVPTLPTSKKCFHCHSKHHRTTSNLCMQCKVVCLGCKRLNTISEKHPLCAPCFIYSPQTMDAANREGRSKSQVYYEWYCVEMYIIALWKIQNVEKRQKQRKSAKKMSFSPPKTQSTSSANS